ncbi:sulfur transferase domain-containing protein [Alkalinema sp. FACHB-956]|uniref:beta-lactamase hydrolase domain-containing protein n=1 Tax=Alkalinema sp. FACHB-956 TaxID=2692768 RepID=UPI0016827850|nr:sulfur transferase domain-containing protein [Alkalinema sp. FACHB-956]MBD2329223.1 phosphatase [Alkalinema sp. FACHB-956]
MVKRINHEFSVAGQVTPHDLQAAAQDGFKSVFNLRAPDEQGFVADEADIAATFGLSYGNAPLVTASVDEARLLEIVAELDRLPKPTLIHCAGGLRATAIALLSIAQRGDLTPEQAIAQATEAGFDLNANPKLKQLLEAVIEQREKVAT